MVFEGVEPLGRLHALCVIEGLGALETELVLSALGDESNEVRRQAVRLSEGFAEEGAAELVSALAQLAEGDDVIVRLQLANTLGEFWRDVGTAEVAAGALWTLWAGAEDEAIETAVMSSAIHHREDLIEIVLRESASRERADALARQLLVMAVRLQMDEAIAGLLGRLLDAGADDRRERFLAVGGFLDALGKEKMSLKTLQERSSAAAGKMVAIANAVVAMAREVLRDASAPEEERIAAAGLPGRGLDGFAADLESMTGILVPQSPVALQLAVVESLGRRGRKEALGLFVDGWGGYGPSVRAAVLREILSRRTWVDLFLDEVASPPELPGILSVAERQAFLQNPTMEVADRAQEVFGVRANGSREAIVEDYAAVLEMEGDADRGRDFFAAACGVCHRMGDVGREVGPDLTALTDKSKESLLSAILDPNRAVEDKFVQYVAMTTDGRTLAGMVIEEAGSSVTLLGMDGTPQVILRGELQSLTSTGRSLMAEGLEAALDGRAMADVVEFVAGFAAP